MLANKYEKVSKKIYSVKLNFNSIEEMLIEFEKAKEQFIKGELVEVKRKNKKKSGGGGGSASPASDSI